MTTTYSRVFGDKYYSEIQSNSISQNSIKSMNSGSSYESIMCNRDCVTLWRGGIPE